jgi:hypothetical protein
MITKDLFFRVFFIKAEKYGTAFSISVGGKTYLVTAKHLLDETKTSFCLKLFRDKTWHDIDVNLVGHGKGEIDVSVLRTDELITKSHFSVSKSPTVYLGERLFFLGFPYKMWGDAGQLIGGLPCPFAKEAILSSFGQDQPLMLYLDAINNEGFSGGPVIAPPSAKGKPARVVGVVAKYRLEQEPVVNKRGGKTGSYVQYNTGFMVAYHIKAVLNIIAANDGV